MWSKSVMWKLHKQFYAELALDAWKLEAEETGATIVIAIAGRAIPIPTEACGLAGPALASHSKALKEQRERVAGRHREMDGDPQVAASAAGTDDEPPPSLVPFFITSNGFTAAAYAKIVWNLLADIAEYPTSQVRGVTFVRPSRRPIIIITSYMPRAGRHGRTCVHRRARCRTRAICGSVRAEPAPSAGRIAVVLGGK